MTPPVLAIVALAVVLTLTAAPTIAAGKHPGIAKTTLDGVGQRDYLEVKADSARDTFFF
jgi:hypothetical protein